MPERGGCSIDLRRVLSRAHSPPVRMDGGNHHRDFQA
jgi:hypothetical protein